jgi:hypothetical protein
VSTMAERRLTSLRQLSALRREKQRREAERLRNLDVFGVLDYEPNCAVRHAAREAGVPDEALPAPCGECPQELFHAATEFDVLYGGAAGGGKTKALLMEGIRACVRNPGIRVGAFRRTYAELEESLLVELANIGFAAAVGATWNASKYNLTFGNGSMIMFRYAESMADATRRQGGQYQLLLFDERTLTPPDVVAFIESRLRSGRRDIPVLGIRSGTNPGGIGHGAVKTRYIDATGAGERTYRDERKRTVRFIPSKLADNPHVNPEYADDLRKLPEKLRQAFLDGAWDVFAGQMFSEWRHDRHTLKPITLPATWKRYQGIDWGFTAPWCALWAAVDEDGRVYFYRELYATQVGEADQAARILAAEASDEAIAVRWADDAMWATRGDAKPISDIYIENGVPITPAGKGAGSRVIGWQRWHSYLAEAPACPHHRALGWETCPMVHVFTTCDNLIRTLPALPHATKGNPEDADTDAEDHAPDAGRYLLTNLGTGPELVFLDDEAPEPVQELAQQYAGRFAHLPTDNDSPFEDRDPDDMRGRVAIAPWASSTPSDATSKNP